MTPVEARAHYRQWLHGNHDNPAVIAACARLARLLAEGGDGREQ